MPASKYVYAAVYSQGTSPVFLGVFSTPGKALLVLQAHDYGADTPIEVLKKDIKRTTLDRIFYNTAAVKPTQTNVIPFRKRK